jgi:hypothetical protein
MLKEVVESFFPWTGNYEIRPFGSGHINDTYKLDLPERNSFILQRINTKVFTDPWIIAETHIKIQNAIKDSAEGLSIPLLIPTAAGKLLYIDNQGKPWRMTTFISDSVTIEVVTESWQAFEAGNGFGWFVKSCNSLEVSDFREPIKDFHRLSFRLMQLNEAIDLNRAGNLDTVRDLIEFYRARESKLSKIEELVDAGKIPLRIVHNDTKINNLLFTNNKASTIIDLDTVGPGIIYYDFGDALRTTSNTSAEDEEDLEKVEFNIERFAAFTRGYLGQINPVLTPSEKEYLYLGPVLMTYIMGIRFLADYLNGGIYYKTSYKEQNVNRSKTQKKLIESMESQETEMKEILHSEFRNRNTI